MTITAKILATVLVSAALASPALAEPITPATPPSTTSTPPAHVGTNTFTVTVSGVRSAQGSVRAGLLMADDTTGTAKNVGGAMATAREGTVTLTFHNLADGEYAVQMFHDEDNNGQMKTNMFGIPSEGYGFSNGARAAFGPPKFSDMKVSVRGNTATVATIAY